MLGKYINQFMADNELSVNEEFFIENMDGNRVLIGCADRYKIEDVDGGILTAAVMNEKDKPPAMLLEAALIDLLNWIVINLNNSYWLKRHFLKKEAEKC